jgi:hypothetical protein
MSSETRAGVAGPDPHAAARHNANAAFNAMNEDRR